MSKNMNTMQKFFIDSHIDMTDNDLAKATGLSLHQVKYYKKKKIGKNRDGTPKELPAPVDSPTIVDQPPVNLRPQPSLRIDALIARGNGTTSMTQAASEAADAFDGLAPDSEGKKKTAMYNSSNPFDDPTRVHRIK